MVRGGWQTADRRYLTAGGICAYTDSGVIGYLSRAAQVPAPASGMAVWPVRLTGNNGIAT